MSSPYRDTGSAPDLASRCLSCGGFFTEGRCAACNAPAPPAGAPRARELQVVCPRCFIGLELQETPDEPAALLYCIGCHGCFVPPVDWALMLEHTSSLGPVPGEDLAPLPAEQGPQRDALGELATCPVCRAAMERVPFDGHRGLPVDVCRVHGIWFDAAELADAVRDAAGLAAPSPDEAPASEAARGALAGVLSRVRRLLGG